MYRVSEPQGTETLDAVLPLVARDLTRFRELLAPSLERFLEPLATCWVIVPDQDVELVNAALPSALFRVMSETELVPPLQETSQTDGWFKQQLIKLAFARRSTSPYYLTLDADVLCTRPTRYSDLVLDARAAVALEDGDPHSGWYWWAEQALGVVRSGRSHAVTPAVLSVEAVALLAQYVRSGCSPDWKPGKAAPGQIDELALAALLRRLPWTEYALYYTFLEHFGFFDTYHFVSPTPLYGNCVWIADAPRFDAWNPAKSFDGGAGFCFTVIQSAAALDLGEVVARVRPYITD